MLKLATGVACVWTALFLNWPLLQCHWTWEGSLSYKMLLVADPQIVGDDHRQRLGPITGWIDQWFNDLYMRHWFQSLLQTLRPDRVGLLGDLLSSQHLPDHEFADRFQRLHWIFKNTIPRQAADRPIEFFYLAGNHDIGYGFDMSKRLIDRFERATGAGPVNFQFHASGHRFIGINAQAIDETSDPQIHLDAWQFIQSVGDSPFNGSNILLTHIPLHKPHGVCHDGPEAQRHISTGAVMWQNMQSENSSEELLRLLRPRFVFNGHDHHGCSVVHYKNGSVVSIQLPLIIDDSIDIQQTTFEITVRSIMAEFHGSIGLFEIHRHRENHYSVHSCEFYHHLTVWVGLIIGLLILLLAALYDLLGWYGEIIKRRPRRSARLKRA